MISARQSVAQRDRPLSEQHSVWAPLSRGRQAGGGQVGSRASPRSSALNQLPDDDVEPVLPAAEPVLPASAALQAGLSRGGVPLGCPPGVPGHPAGAVGSGMSVKPAGTGGENTAMFASVGWSHDMREVCTRHPSVQTDLSGKYVVGSTQMSIVVPLSDWLSSSASCPFTSRD